MEPMLIRTLKPNVSQQQAVRMFSSIGPASILWRLRSGPLQRIAAAYVPFALFRARYHLGRTAYERTFAIDAVNGSLDLIEFPEPPAGNQLISIETGNCLLPAISGERSAELLREKVLRVAFQQGFFKLRDPRLEIIPLQTGLHLPYWLAFYGCNVVRCRALDAIRRRIEGAKASAFFEEWLAAQDIGHAA